MPPFVFSPRKNSTGPMSASGACWDRLVRDEHRTSAVRGGYFLWITRRPYSTWQILTKISHTGIKVYKRQWLRPLLGTCKCGCEGLGKLSGVTPEERHTSPVRPTRRRLAATLTPTSPTRPSMPALPRPCIRSGRQSPQITSLRRWSCRPEPGATPAPPPTATPPVPQQPSIGPRLQQMQQQALQLQKLNAYKSLILSEQPPQDPTGRLTRLSSSDSSMWTRCRRGIHPAATEDGTG